MVTCGTILSVGCLNDRQHQLELACARKCYRAQFRPLAIDSEPNIVLLVTVITLDSCISPFETAATENDDAIIMIDSDAFFHNYLLVNLQP